MRIGIDLDNTLINYDAAFHACARQLGWLAPNTPRAKTAIRDHVRTLPNGEHCWRELQARAYGPQILNATLAPGADRFLRACKRNAVPVAVVSHKTHRAAFDPTIDLHAAAQRWLARYLFAHADTLGVTPAVVHFEPTREAKATRIAALGCTHWIDDLPEFFESSDLPTAITRILYAPSGVEQTPAGTRTFADWNAITAWFANEAGWTLPPETPSQPA